MPGGHRQGIVDHAVTNHAEPYNVNALLPPGVAGEAVSAAVRRGGVVFHHGAALHSSHSNLTTRPRRAYAIHFVAAGCSFQPAAPAVAAGLPIGALLSTSPAEMPDDPVLRILEPDTPAKL